MGSGHSNQEMVSHIIEVIDELIEFEESTAMAEREAEGRRQARFEFDMSRFEEADSFLDASIRDLEGDISSLNIRVSTLNSDLRDYR